MKEITDNKTALAHDTKRFFISKVVDLYQSGLLSLVKSRILSKFPELS